MEATVAQTVPALAQEAAAGTSALLGIPAASEPTTHDSIDPQVELIQSDGQVADAEMFAPPSNPAGYLFPPPPPGQVGDLAFETTNREAMLHAGIPAPIGSHIATLWNKAMTAPLPTDSQLALGKQQALEVLGRNGANAEETLALARTVVAKMAEKQPQVWTMLERTGLGNDPWLISSLANIAKARGAKV